MTARVVFAVVLIVGLALLLAVAGIVALAAFGLAVPDVLQNIAVGGLTGLLGLLAPRPGAGADESAG